MAQPVNFPLLKKHLEEIVAEYNSAYLESDPVAFVHRYTDPLDQEVVAWIASAFAYGRVSQIFRTLEGILSQFSEHPHADLTKWQSRRWRQAFRNFSHRFSNSDDLLTLLFLIHTVIRKFDSVGNFFEICFGKSDGSARGLLTQVALELRATDFSDFGDHPGDKFWYLLPSPQNGSACKRWNMFLRWMLRPADGIDLGLWDFLPPSQLILPLDTHTARLSRFLGLTRRKAASWQMAEEVTQALRKLDAHDPIKYDFALSRLGILKICPGAREAIRCRTCPLYELCLA